MTDLKLETQELALMIDALEILNPDNDTAREVRDQLLISLRKQSQEVPDREAIIATAREEYCVGSDNDIEIDDEPALSPADDGCWVGAWVWVELPRYEVIVGNIGSVYVGPDKVEAERKFAEYVSQSKSGAGRAAGEPVTLLEEDEVEDEYQPQDAEVEA